MPTESFNLGESRLIDVVNAIASAQISPGAGAAGAVTLALAAACAGKAVAISLKHRESDVTLLRARQVLDDIAHIALAGADEDASRFEALVRGNDPSAAAG